MSIPYFQVWVMVALDVAVRPWWMKSIELLQHGLFEGACYLESWWERGRCDLSFALAYWSDGLIDKQILLKILAQCFLPSLRREEGFLRFFFLKRASCLSLGKTPLAAAVWRRSPLEPSLKTVFLGSPGDFSQFSNQIEPFYIILNSFTFKNNYSFNIIIWNKDSRNH